MDSRSFFYKSARIYKSLLKILHGSNYNKRYETINEKIGDGQTVLEPGCGPGILPDFMANRKLYSGFDINEEFIEYGRSQGLDVKVDNALNPDAYKKVDAVVLIDMLHHVGPEKERQLLEYSRDSARNKLIICEPFVDRYLLVGRIPGLGKMLEKHYNWIERDGNNQVRFKNIRTRDELLEQVILGFGVIPSSVKRDVVQLGEDIIATYYLT